MSSIAGQSEAPARVSADKQPDQTPWRSAKDHAGRHAVAQGAGKRRALSVSVMLDFDGEQSEWLRREAARSGRDYDTILKDLLDRARANRP
jgi:hypothetical protein